MGLYAGKLCLKQRLLERMIFELDVFEILDLVYSLLAFAKPLCVASEACVLSWNILNVGKSQLKIKVG